jgi:hypothetical protein
MHDETKKSAVSGEWKPVPMAQLKKWHRDLDACQKVMWLRGGFDPAYCMDAQDCLKEMDSVLATSVPPAGDVEVIAEVVNKYGDPEAFAERDLLRRTEVDKLKIGTELVDREHVTRVQAENAALQQRLNVADQCVDDLESDIAAARELLKHGSSPTPAHCEAVLDFLAGQSAPAAKGEEPLCLLCLDEKTVAGPKAGDFVRDCPDCCGDEG